VDGFVLDLFLGSAHQISDTSLSILSPVCLDVSHFHRGELPVEAVEERHEEEFFAFNPDVVVGIVEGPGIGSALSKHEEIFGTGDEAQSDQSSEENEGMSSCHAEMFIVRTDLFGAVEFGLNTLTICIAEEDGFISIVERVDVGSLG